MLVPEVFSGGCELFIAGVFIEVVSEPSQVFDVLDFFVHATIFFGCGPLEEVPSYGWFGWADPEEDGLCLPELVHDGVGHVSHLLLLVRHAFPKCVQVVCCVVPIKLCLALLQQGGNLVGLCVEGGVQLSSYGGMHLGEVLFFDGEYELVHASVGLLFRGGWCEGEDLCWDMLCQHQVV